MLFAKTRFSVFHSGSKEWNASQKYKTEAEYLDYLYSDSRLSARIGIFIDVSLPILEAISRKVRFVHVVQYSKELPEKYLKLLEKASARYSFVRLSLVDDESRGFQSVITNELIKNPCVKYFAQFNLDDDDLLSVSFPDNAMKYINKQNVGNYISLGKGLTGFYDVKNKSISNIREVVYPKINIGLMAVCEFDHSERKITAPPHGNHMKVENYAPILIDCSKPSYFWMRTIGQDTGLTKESEREEVNKINRELDFYPLFKDKFTIKEEFLFTPSSNCGTDTCVALDAPVKLDDKACFIEAKEKYAGSIRIEYTIKCGADILNNKALVSLNLSEELSESDFQLSGLSKSANKEIGYYRYLKTLPGTTDGTVSVDIPCSLESISFRRFGSTSDIDLLSVSVINF